MYFLHDIGSDSDELNRRQKEILQILMEQIPPEIARTKISSNTSVYASSERKGLLYYLVEGTLSYVRGEKLLYYFDAGDFVGIEHSLVATPVEVVSDFAVVVQPYQARTFYEKVFSSPDLVQLWNEYLVIQSSLMSALANAMMKKEDVSPPDISAFRTGETIILQGSPALEVFTLVEGEAEALVDGVQVGRILPGEIFGVIAALTGIPRTASVAATKPCTVLSIKKENFVNLIETRPSTFLKVVEDMARTMVELNEKVVSLSLSKY